MIGEALAQKLVNSDPTPDRPKLPLINVYIAMSVLNDDDQGNKTYHFSQEIYFHPL